MAIVLRECITEELGSVVRGLWSNRLDEKDIRKEVFPVWLERSL
jgi:hypothetical protein